MHITSDSYMLKFLKRLYLRCLGVGESIGAARAAQQLFSLNYRDEAQAVITNYVRAARARDRLISQLQDTK